MNKTLLVYTCTFTRWRRANDATKIKVTEKAYGMLFFGIFGLTFSDLILRWNLINFQLESLSVFFASLGNVFAEGILVFRTKGNFTLKTKALFIGPKLPVLISGNF